MDEEWASDQAEWQVSLNRAGLSEKGHAVWSLRDRSGSWCTDVWKQLGVRAPGSVFPWPSCTWLLLFVAGTSLRMWARSGS